MKRSRRAGADQQVEAILERIRTARSFDFRNYKRATLRRRIERRAADRRCKSIADYAALLDRDPAEFDALIGALLIKVTSFFRDRELWDALSQKVLPQLLSEKRQGEELRVWCAGSATGEEAVSVALLLAEAMGPGFQRQEVKIFGTDVDEKAVAYARHGVYTREQVASVPREMLKQYFVEEGPGYSLRKGIRRAVVFGVNNLVSDAPISRLDLLICRNVFIYLDVSLQKRVLTRFHYALRRHGVLVLGKSELIPFAGKVFEVLDGQHRIYRKDGRRDATVAQERLSSLLEQESLTRAQIPVEFNAVDQFHREVVDSVPVPLIATAPDGTLLLWNAAAATLWGRSENEVAGKRLPALSLPGLSGELLVEKTALVRSGKSKRERAAGVLHKGGQPPVQLSVEVTALRDSGKEATGMLYAVQDVTALHEAETELRKSNQERQSGVEELQTVNEELQSTNEELETTNEELQSANEELQTTNEELQSTNEELETTNEELQSTNAELDATNRELAHRTDELNSLAYVQRTIIRSLAAAVVVLDEEGRIKMWNLAAERLLGVPEDEAVGQVLWAMKVPALNGAVLKRLRKALAQHTALRAEQVEYELANGNSGRGTLAAVPIVDDGAVHGSVVIFEDVTRMSGLVAEVAELKANNGKRNRRN